MNESTLCQSYVRHETSYWFVSTINRESSAMLGSRMYAETIVWAWNPETKLKEKLVHMDSDDEGEISTHQSVVEKIHKSGAFWEKEEAEA